MNDRVWRAIGVAAFIIFVISGIAKLVIPKMSAWNRKQWIVFFAIVFSTVAIHVIMNRRSGNE